MGDKGCGWEGTGDGAGGEGQETFHILSGCGTDKMAMKCGRSLCCAVCALLCSAVGANEKKEGGSDRRTLLNTYQEQDTGNTEETEYTENTQNTQNTRSELKKAIF